MAGRFFINLILLAAILAAGFAAMEVGVRMTLPQTLVRDYARPDPDLGTYIAPKADYVDVYTKEGPYRVRTNAMGFRMEEEVDPSAERLRVLVYGDSFTFGWGLEYADTYFASLKNAAEKADPSVQLLNAGVGGYSTGHIKKLLKRHIQAIEPAAVVYFINNNDLIDNVVTDIDYRVTDFTVDGTGKVQLTDVQPFSTWKRRLLNHTPYAWLNRNSHLFVLAKDQLKRALKWKRGLDRPTVAAPEHGGATEVPEDGIDAAPAFTAQLPESSRNGQSIDLMVAVTTAHMRRLIGIAREARLPLITVWVPAEAEMFGDVTAAPERKLFDQARRELTRLAKSTPGFFFIDTTELIPSGRAWAKRKGTLRLSDGHFNREGAQWYAELVRPPVLEFLKGVGWTRRKKN